MNKNEKYTVLWSHSQQAFHIEELERTEAIGLECLKKNMLGHYLLIRVCESYEEASAFCNEIKKYRP